MFHIHIDVEKSHVCSCSKHSVCDNCFSSLENLRFMPSFYSKKMSCITSLIILSHFLL